MIRFAHQLFGTITDHIVPLRHLCIGLALIIVLYTFLLGGVAYALPTQPIPTTIDTTEDFKAMGYPDGRKVTRDLAGNLYVAYRKKYKRDRLTAYHIFVAKSVDNGRSWSVLNQGHPIETIGGQNQRVPAIAVDSRGTIHVVWYGKDGNQYNSAENQIKYVQSADQGQTWTPWQNIAYVTGYRDQAAWQEHPTLHIDQNDTLYVVWEGNDPWYSAATQVKLIRSTDGGQSWSLWKNVAPSPNNHSRPTIVGNGRDALYILAYGRSGDKQQIIYSRSTDGGSSWSSWASVAPSPVEQRHVSAVMDSQGILHVVWRQQPVSLLTRAGFTQPQAKTQINYATFDGTSWSEPLAMRSNQNAAQTFPSIGVVINARLPARSTEQHTHEDTIWIVWSETRGSVDFPNDVLLRGQIYAAAKSAQGWSTPLALAVGDGNIYASLARMGGSVAGNHDGAIDVVWLDNQQSLKQIRFAQLTNAATGIGAITAPVRRPNGLLRLQPLPTALLASGVVDAPRWLERWDAVLRLNPHLAREMKTLLLIIISVTGYVLLKFVVSRFLAAALTRTNSRPQLRGR